MKRFFSQAFVLLCLLIAAGCTPHTTGETEVGVRTRKLAFFGPKGVEDQVYAPGCHLLFSAVYQ